MRNNRFVIKYDTTEYICFVFFKISFFSSNDPNQFNFFSPQKNSVLETHPFFILAHTSYLANY